MSRPGGIDETLLDETLGVVEKARDWSPRTVAKLEALLHAADDAALCRINPMTFARDRGVTTAEVIDLFLHATRAGIFTMNWHLLCPRCGSAVESFASLRALHRHFFCAMCLVATDANLDDYIQVTFTVAPRIRRLAFHDLEAMAAADVLFKQHFTPEARLGDLDGPRLLDLLRDMMMVMLWVAPGERLEFAFDAGAGLFSAAEFQGHSGAVVDVAAGAPATHVDFVIGETDLTGSVAAVRPGASPAASRTAGPPG
jgi:hypothetical protein